MLLHQKWKDNLLILEPSTTKQICLCKEAAKLACYLASTQAGANTAAGCPKPDDNVSFDCFFFTLRGQLIHDTAIPASVLLLQFRDILAPSPSFLSLLAPGIYPWYPRIRYTAVGGKRKTWPGFLFGGAGGIIPCRATTKKQKKNKGRNQIADEILVSIAGLCVDIIKLAEENQHGLATMT